MVRIAWLARWDGHAPTVRNRESDACNATEVVVSSHSFFVRCLVIGLIHSVRPADPLSQDEEVASRVEVLDEAEDVVEGAAAACPRHQEGGAIRIQIISHLLAGIILVELESRVEWRRSKSRLTPFQLYQFVCNHRS